MHHLLHQPTTLQPTGYGSLEWRGLFGSMQSINKRSLIPANPGKICKQDSSIRNPQEAGR